MTGLELITELTELGQEALTKEVVLSISPTDDYDGQPIVTVWNRSDAVVLLDHEVKR